MPSTQEEDDLLSQRAHNAPTPLLEESSLEASVVVDVLANKTTTRTTPSQPQPQALFDNDQPNDNNIDDNPRIQYFAEARTDRVGAQLLDLLLLDAYAFKRHGVTGGACLDWTTSTIVVADNQPSVQRVQQKQDMIAFLGLQQHLGFACPTAQQLASKRAVRVDPTAYRMTRKTFTTAWYTDLMARSSSNYSFSRPTQQQQSANTKQVAVHVRRGDYDPCHAALRSKYLPNAYYLAALDEQLPNICPDAITDCNVTIYSEPSLREDFAVFEERGYTIDINTTTTVPALWQAFISADALFISKSSFSLVPALWNHQCVVYPVMPYKVQKLNLSHWQVVSDSVMNATEAARESLVQEHCLG